MLCSKVNKSQIRVRKENCDSKCNFCNNVAKVEMTWNTYSHLYPKEEEKAIAILNVV